MVAPTYVYVVVNRVKYAHSQIYVDELNDMRMNQSLCTFNITVRTCCICVP